MPAESDHDPCGGSVHPSSSGVLVDSGYSPASGASPWTSMSIGEILGIVDSMNDGAATGDATAVRVAIDVVDAAAVAVSRAFRSEAGGTVGVAADASAMSAAGAVADIRSAAAVAAETHSALVAAATTLSAARANRPTLESVRQAIADTPENAPALRSGVDVMMSATYTIPMNNARGSVPSAGIVGDGRSLDHDPAGERGARTPAAAADRSPAAGSNVDSSLSQPSSPARRGEAADLGAVGPVPPTIAPDGESTARTSTAAMRQVTTRPTAPQPTVIRSTQDRPVPPAAHSATPVAPGGVGADDTRRADPSDPLSAAAPVGSTGGHGRASGSALRLTGSGNSMVEGGRGGIGGVGGMWVGIGGSLAPVTQRLLTGLPITTVGTVTGGALPTGPGRSVSGPFGAAPHGDRDRGRDGRHAIPSYLHTRENGAEIVGALPLAGPAIIGGPVTRRTGDDLHGDDPTERADGPTRATTTPDVGEA